jgi:hypothetical protein
MRRTRVWLARLTAVALALSFVAGCGDDATGPSDVDVQSTQAAVDAVISQFFMENQGVQSLELFGTAIATTFPSVAAFDLLPDAETTSFFNMADRIRTSMTAVLSRKSSAASLMAIPQQALGKTFVYNPQTQSYEASTRTGAPSNGVRFILYDDLTNLNEIGYLDLIDQSNFNVTPAAINITLSIVVNGVGEVLNYNITGSAGDTGGTLLINGFLSDGTDKLTFDIRISGSDATGFDALFTLGAPQVSITLDMSESTGGVQSLKVTITHGTDEILIVINAAADGTIQSGSGIFFNNTPVAVISGNIEQDNVQVRNAEGNPLTQEELVALSQIFVGIEQAFAVMTELVALGLGLIGIVFFF